MNGVVIVGASQAGLQAAVALRDSGYGEPITLVGQEDHLPYQRPPLSKGFVTQKVSSDQLSLRNAAFYEQHDIRLILGQTVDRVDRRECTAVTRTGHSFAFDSLVLTVGSAPRIVPIAGGQLEGVLSLRTVDDAEQIVKTLGECERLVVLGGGFIGLEIAATARSLGLDVTLVEAARSLMGRAVSAGVSEFFFDAHRSRGLDIRLGETAAEIMGDSRGAVTGVRLSSGEILSATAVLMGVGAVPNTALARGLGLETDAGVLADPHARTSDDVVLAAGDCAEHRDLFGGRMLLTSVQNAIDQATVAAKTIVGDLSQPYAAIPWFWSDQYEFKLQMAGLPQHHDRVVTRGVPADGAFTQFHLRDGRLVWAESVSKPGEHVFARRLIASGALIDPGRLADLSVPMREVALA